MQENENKPAATKPAPKRRTWHIAFDGMRFGSQAMGALTYTTGAQGLTSEHLRAIAEHVRETNQFDTVRIGFFGELFDTVTPV